MKKPFFSLVVLLLPCTALGTGVASDLLELTAGKTKIHLVPYGNHEGWIGRNCRKSCKALDAVRSLDAGKLPRDWHKGGVNPGAALCKHAAKGRVVLAFDGEKNQYSLCLFDDDSMVTTGAFKSKRSTH